MERLLVALLIVALAAGVAEIVRRRRRVDAPTQSRGELPSQVDRADFPRPDAPWLVAVFTSATCSTCADVLTKARVLESDDVAVAEASFQDHRELHER
jgi:hypothetical protein